MRSSTIIVSSCGLRPLRARRASIGECGQVRVISFFISFRDIKRDRQQAKAQLLPTATPAPRRGMDFESDRELLTGRTAGRCRLFFADDPRQPFGALQPVSEQPRGGKEEV